MVIRRRITEANKGNDFYMGEGATLTAGKDCFVRNEDIDASAETIYGKLVDVFGFKESKINRFRKQRELNTADCSPEGYGVIFANPYDDWEIEGGLEAGYLSMIKEEPISESLIRKEAPVLIFLRGEVNGYTAYLFAGVYKPGEVSEDGCRVTYDLKSKVYPENA